MSINGESEDISHRLVDDAKTVTQAESNGGHRPGNIWAAVEASDTVHSATV